MKKVILLLIIALAACSSKEVPEYFQQNYSDVPAIAEKCNINNIDYYVKGQFIYHENNAGSRIVYTLSGEYLKPKAYPRWQLKLHANKNDSIYTKTQDLIDSGMLSGEIECIDVTSLPSDFEQWLSTHESLYNERSAKEVMEIA